MVGLVIEVPLEDAGMEHTLRAEVINRHGTVLAELQNLFRVSDEGLFPHEVQQVPLVLSITGVRARTWGTHQVRLYLDDELVRALTLYVVPAAGTQAVRPVPAQSRARPTRREGTVVRQPPTPRTRPERRLPPPSRRPRTTAAEGPPPSGRLAAPTPSAGTEAAPTEEPAGTPTRGHPRGRRRDRGRHRPEADTEADS